VIDFTAIGLLLKVVKVTLYVVLKVSNILVFKDSNLSENEKTTE